MVYKLSAIYGQVPIADTKKDGIKLIRQTPIKTPWFIIDSCVANHPDTLQLRNLFGKSVQTIVKCGENCKSQLFFEKLLKTNFCKFSQPPDTLIAIGGGTLLNLTTFIAGYPRTSYFKDRSHNW